MATELHYLDSTVLARDLLGPSSRPASDAIAVSSEVTAIELSIVIGRRLLAGSLDVAGANLLRRQIPVLLAPLHLFPLANEMLERAAAPFGVAINALDAIHVATAEVVARDAEGTLVFWTLDPRRAAAATSRGMTVRGPAADA